MQAVGWSKNEVATLDSRGYIWAGLSQPLTWPRPSCAIQDDDLIKKSGFFVPSNCLRTGYCLKNLISFGEFDITYYVKFSFQEKISLKTKSYSHQNRLFCSCLHCFFVFGQKFTRSSFSFFFIIISSHSVPFTHPGLALFQYARNVTTTFLVTFVVFSESLPSIKFCISFSDNLEKRFLLASLGSIIDHRWLQLKTVRGGPSLSIKRTWACAEDHAIFKSVVYWSCGSRGGTVGRALAYHQCVGNLRATGLSVKDCCVSPSLNKVDLFHVLLYSAWGQQLHNCIMQLNAI